MQFAFFIPRHSKKFLQNHRFCWKSGNDADSRGREVCSLRPYDTVRTIIRKISMWLTSDYYHLETSVLIFTRNEMNSFYKMEQKFENA